MHRILIFSTLLLLYSSLLQPIVLAAQSFNVPWSTVKYGPDGPWQAVRVTLGGSGRSVLLSHQNTSEVSLYPGGAWDTFAFSDLACEQYINTNCSAGGTWNPKESTAISWPATWVDNSSGIEVRDGQRYALGLTIGDKTVWNASLASLDSGSVTYQNGRVGVPLGRLALGADRTQQNFSTGGSQVGDSIDAALFPGQLFDEKMIPSHSYGLHIGSAVMDYSGSLVFGGYNKGRVIGPVTSFGDDSAVDLLDIGVGVEYGPSPFKVTDKLLSTGQIKINLNPLSPYITLPRETCDNLANLLPITFDTDLKYYIWKTDDPLFKQYVSSPAYVSFAFPPAPGSASNVIIKVPLTLLNLTLDRPITDTPKQYFPCVPSKENGGPVLGRAFLQATFIGRNWRTHTSWLAQAPGPGEARDGLGPQNMDIPEGATTIEPFSDPELFRRSWEKYWTALPGSDGDQPTTSQQPEDEPQPSKHGLSTGAKAGIGVGVFIGVVLVTGVAFFLWRRNQQQRELEVQPPENDVPPFEAELPRVKFGHTRPISKLKSGDSARCLPPVELPALQGEHTQG